MTKVAYIGSCVAEQLTKAAFGLDNLVFRAYRINTVSFMNDTAIDIRLDDGMSFELRRHLGFELRKGFPARLVQARPDMLMVDFIRDIRTPLITDGSGYLTLPYELLDSPFDVAQRVLEGKRLIYVGSEDYTALMLQALDRFCDLCNTALPDTQVVLIDPCPTRILSSTIIDQRYFNQEFMELMLRQRMWRAMMSYVQSRLKNARTFVIDGDHSSTDDAPYGAYVLHYTNADWTRIGGIFRDFLAGRTVYPAGDSSERRELARSFAALAPIAQTVLDRQSLQNVLRTAGTMEGEVLAQIIKRKRENYSKTGVSPGEVTEAFLWLLDRTPESLETIIGHMGAGSPEGLRQMIMRSAEFQAKVQQFK